jgi:hypothetical protein
MELHIKLTALKVISVPLRPSSKGTHAAGKTERCEVKKVRLWELDCLSVQKKERHWAFGLDFEFLTN